MTTLAIIGSGILGRSLIYTIAKEQKSFEKVTLFYSDNFLAPCTFQSTAIVAPRGLSAGLSPLGDLLLDGFKLFSEHVELDLPHGVEKIIQYSAATKKLDEFKKRYPQGNLSRKFLKSDTYMAEDTAYLIDPAAYATWLLSEAVLGKTQQLEIIEDLVTEVSDNELVHVKTLNGRNLSFDKVIFAGGVYNRFWKDLAPDSKLKTSKSVQGCYLEFNQLDFKRPSFSLTLDGDNLVWNEPLGRLLIGSTSLETHHLLPPLNDLKDIYERLKLATDLELPKMDKGEIKIGLREKAQKREPYVVESGNTFLLGGLYKNGFTLSLKIARNFSRQHL